MSTTSISPPLQVQNGDFSNLLSELPEGTPCIEYSNIKNLQCHIESQASKYYTDNSLSPFIVVTEIPNSILEDFDRAYPDKGPRIYLDFNSKFLVVETMVLAPHEILKAHFELEFNMKIQEMGLYPQLEISAATRVRYGSFVKEPDASWKLLDTASPTLVLETGLSERSNQLAIEAQAWLDADGSETQIALTAKVHRDAPHITFQMWEKDTQQVSNVVTRGYSKAKASRTQSIEISHDHGITRASGDLKIPFRKMFRRPGRTANEQDIIITREKFEHMAERVWRDQGLM